MSSCTCARRGNRVCSDRRRPPRPRARTGSGTSDRWRRRSRTSARFRLPARGRMPDPDRSRSSSRPGLPARSAIEQAAILPASPGRESVVPESVTRCPAAPSARVRCRRCGTRRSRTTSAGRPTSRPDSPVARFPASALAKRARAGFARGPSSPHHGRDAEDPLGYQPPHRLPGDRERLPSGA